jgi:hypothetical protein
VPSSIFYLPSSSALDFLDQLLLQFFKTVSPTLGGLHQDQQITGAAAAVRCRQRHKALHAQRERLVQGQPGLGGELEDGAFPLGKAIGIEASILVRSSSGSRANDSAIRSSRCTSR